MNKDVVATRIKLLDAALMVIRTKGYSATTVDDLCSAAGVTKGAFFHYFASKEQLAIEAADHFSAQAEGLFAQAPYRQYSDPIERLFGYVDFRIAILKGAIPEFTCLLGTMVQEVYTSHPTIRQTCERRMGEHIDVLVRDIDQAMKDRNMDASWISESLGYYMQSVIQGAFIYAKAKGGTSVAVECLMHLRRYLECIFSRP